MSTISERLKTAAQAIAVPVAMATPYISQAQLDRAFSEPPSAKPLPLTQADVEQLGRPDDLQLASNLLSEYGLQALDYRSKPHGHCTNPRCKDLFAAYLDAHDRLQKYEPDKNSSPMHLNAVTQSPSAKPLTGEARELSDADIESAARSAGLINTFGGREIAHTEPLKLFLIAVLQAEQEKHLIQRRQCSRDPRAPHGFDRNASHNADRFVCLCEGWIS